MMVNGHGTQDRHAPVQAGRGHHTKPNLDWQGTVLDGEDPIPMRLFHYRLEVKANCGNSRKN